MDEDRFKQPAGCLEASQTEAYEVGLKGVVVGQGDTYEEALSDVKSAFVFHIETFGKEVIGSESPIGDGLHELELNHL